MGNNANRSRVAEAVRRNLARSAWATLYTAPILGALGGSGLAYAQTPASASQPSQSASEAAATEQPVSMEAIVVSGSRIVRDGYNSPTPVSVVSVETLNNNATSNVADALNTLPNFAGSSTPQSSAVTVTSGTQAVNGLNIGGLGATRTLVLVNGQRTVGSTLTGLVDVSELPQQLISRVDVVTGGASAGYGSDALTGIVNFVLDTKYEGVKGELSGGMTNYGDDGNYRANLTMGTAFGGGRGHVQLSGEADVDNGVLVAKRPWNDTGIGYITNPNYSPTNGQPLNLLVPQIGVSTASYGGTIASGPFRGTKFGPGGTQSQTVFGNIVSDPLMSGGSWASQTVANVAGAAMQPEQRRQNVFGRVSWDLTDNIEVYGQTSYAHLHSYSTSVPIFYPGPGAITIQSDNAYLPANIATGLAAAGVPNFKFGTFNGDLGIQHPITDRQVARFLVGADGKFDMFGTRWTWDGYISYGRSLQQVESNNTINIPNYLNAIDAVHDPVTGDIVCRSTVTNPGNGCQPLNLFGLGVASQAAKQYVIANPYNHAQLNQRVASINLHGSPFNDWAGPVSFATGVEHRKEATTSFADPLAASNPYFLSAGLGYSGSFSVTEGYIETEVPLLKDLPFAKSFDLNAAVRQTHYNTFGTTRTWKAGITWSPFDDLRFRATRSLDIREPTLVDLYQAGTITSNAITDPFNNNATTPFQSKTTGNPNLVPERAFNTVVGFVYQPAWLQHFSTSLDYYDVDISGGITSFSAQQLINLCFNGSQAACSTFTRTPTVVNFTIAPLNFATERARRVELESTYLLPMDVVRMPGTLGFHAAVTHYITDVINSGAIGSIPQQNVGVNNTTPVGTGLPKYKFTFMMDYAFDPFEVSLTARGLSHGVYSNSNIECTVGCPASTANNVTVSDNHIAGAIYFDLATSYKFEIGRVKTEAFFNVRNMFNKTPPVVAQGPGATGYDFFPANQNLYDILGAVFRLGIRANFK